MLDYVELHAHSYFSLLDGASSPRDLVQRAHQLGMTAIALTDHNNLYGAVEFAQIAKSLHIKPIFGAEMTLEDSSHLTLLVRNEQGWENLCHMITTAQHNAPKGQAILTYDDLLHYTDGLICLTGCQQGAVVRAVQANKMDVANHLLSAYREAFDHVWIELQHHRLAGNNHINQMLVKLSHQHHLGYVATNNVHYAHRERSRLQDILMCIRHNLPLDDAVKYLRPNSEYDLKSGDDLLLFFVDYPDALANTWVVADECNFDLTYGLQDLPQFPTPTGLTTIQYLRHLCLTSSDYQHPERVEHELPIIESAGLANYFLIVWDIVRFSREQGIRCQGRGSAANSMVAFLLGISPIDPVTHDLVFERFLSVERQIVPDIDIDFDAELREQVIQYVYDRYGTDHAAMACTFITFRSKSAIRDVGKALGIPVGMVDSMARNVDRQGTLLQENAIDQPNNSPLQVHLVELVAQIKGLPRHLSIHNGGMVITGAPITSRLPTEPATMPGRVVVQWDKESLEDAGLVKIDILGLRMLAAVSQASVLADTDVDNLRVDDPQVFSMIQAADTVGVFQVESRAQMNTLPRFQPHTFEDLIIAISLIRPGPIQGDMVHPYLRRRLGQEETQYFHPLLKPALKETLGVILFQEQVLKVAHDLAGFTPGQGELLRRALGKKDAVSAIKSFHADFIIGAMQKGVNKEIADQVFIKLLGFGSYSFPKSHAAAFAVVVYQSAWLRRYHPAAFYTALLNNQPMGFYKPSVVVNDARRQGIHILAVDINLSDTKCSMLDKKTIRLGLNYVRSVSSSVSKRILSARLKGEFTSLQDMIHRTHLPHRIIENLIQAGALDTFGLPRRDLIWELGRMQPEKSLPLDSDDDVQLPDLTRLERLNMEYEVLGLSTEDHIMAVLRDTLSARRICHSRQVEDAPTGMILTCAGLVVVRQAPPTAKGFRFITLEDEFGFMNVIVKPPVYDEYRRLLRTEQVLLVQGEIQREGAVVNVIAIHFSGI